MVNFASKTLPNFVMVNTLSLKFFLCLMVATSQTNFMGIGNLGTFCHHPKIRWLLYTILLAASGAPLRTHGFLASGLYLNVLVIGSITPTSLENPVGWFLTFYKGRIENLSIHGVLS
jgi:hypothetical protein